MDAIPARRRRSATAIETSDDSAVLTPGIVWRAEARHAGLEPAASADLAPGDSATEASAGAGAAVEKALASARHERIGIIGRSAAVVADWLQCRGYTVDVIEAGEASARNGRRRTGGKWGVVLAVDWVEQGENAVQLFRRVKRRLTRDGRVVAVMPNATRAGIRLAMLLGRAAPDGQANHRPVRSLTDAERLLNAAGLSVSAIERFMDRPDDVARQWSGIPDAVVKLLADDEDAMTSHYVLFAETGGQAANARLYRRLRQIADDHRSAALNLRRLDERLAELEVRVRHWSAETDALALQERQSAGAPMPVDELREDARHIREQLAAWQARDAEQVAARQIRDGEQRAAFSRASEDLAGQAAALKSVVTRIERIGYRALVVRVRQAIARTVPAGATVAVISRGDPELVALDGHVGWHFPQTDAGVYAGHHPATGEAAVAHLEGLYARGARYLVVPRTCGWWLEHYGAFNQFLHQSGRCVFRDPRTCVIFAVKAARR